MKKFSFLFRPFFFLFSLLFATIMVMKIEEIKPSEYSGSGINIPSKIHFSVVSKQEGGGKNYLKNLIASYKTGKIDSIVLDKKLTFFLDSTQNYSAK